MSEEHEQPATAVEKYAYARMWHPRASLQVSIPIPIAAGLQPADCERLMLSVDNLLAAGWLANLEGVEAGEDAEEVGAVLRRTVDSRTHPSGECPRLALYSPNAGMKWKFLDVYLNTEDEIAVFEKVSGLRIAAIPNFEGTAAPQRGDKRTDKYIVPAPKPFKVVLKNNPHYDEDKAAAAKAANEAYTIPKRIFVRWLDAPVDTKPPAQTYAEHQAGTKPAAAPANASQEQRIAKIMEMNLTDLDKAYEYASKLPVDEGQPFMLACRKRSFQVYMNEATNAVDESVLTDIEHAAYTQKRYGVPTYEQKRDLDAVIKNKRHALEAKGGKR